jgi:hypothetical protein
MKPWNKHFEKRKLQVEKSNNQEGLKVCKSTREVNIWKNETYKWKNATYMACDEVNI